jgi:uncharacterized protein YndB with AHSA1/START domain
MNERLTAKANVTIRAPLEKVWEGLTDPAIIKRYMMGATVTSEWKQGSPITWKGEWNGKTYEDRGKILEIQPLHRLRYSHYSPLSGDEDKPENYHNVTVDLLETDGAVRVDLEQDNNETPDARDHSQKNWEAMLAALKKTLES